MAKYLLKRDGRFYAVLEIPAKVRSQFSGKVRFVKSLKTDRPSLARQRVGPMVANWKSQIAVALGEDDNDFIWPEDDGSETSALMLLHRLRAAKGDDKREMWRDLETIAHEGGKATEPERKVASLMEHVDITVQDIRATAGDDDAGKFYDTATGGRERYDAHLDDWLALSTATDKTKRMLRYDVRRLAEAMPIAQDISRARVKGWVTALQVEQGLAPKTVTRILGALKGYWRHLQSIEAVSCRP